MASSVEDSVVAATVYDRIHQDHPVDDLRERRADKRDQHERRGALLLIALLPGAQRGHRRCGCPEQGTEDGQGQGEHEAEVGEHFGSIHEQLTRRWWGWGRPKTPGRGRWRSAGGTVHRESRTR